MNKIQYFKKAIVLMMLCLSVVAFARPPHHHHHHHHHRSNVGLAIGAGILGAGLLANAISRPTTTVVQQPVVVAPAPVVTPAPVVVQQPVAVQTGHYETRVENVWVEGRYVDQVTPQGTTVRVWQPGHYEQRQTQVWVQ